MRMYVDIVGQMLRTLWAHKLRSFLTMFGIAWGVGSLLLLVGLGEGFRSGNRRELSQMGENIMFQFSGQVPAVNGTTTGARPYFLTVDDWQAIKDECPNVLHPAPVINRQDIRAVSAYANTNGQTFGVIPDYNNVRFIPIAAGRWFTEADNNERRQVVVIGHEMRKNMFPGRPALGETILLNGLRFEVIGYMDVIGKEESNNGTNQRVFIPFNTMREFFPLKDEKLPDGAISFINYKPKEREQHELAKQEVRRVIARRHGFSASQEDAFEDWDTVQSEQTVGKIFDAMNVFLGSVGLVTLALGGIGIINIMLVAVTERTKEIGLRRALGATRTSIMAQFFMEGAFLTLISGGIGIAAAGGFMTALNAVITSPGPFDPPRLVPWSAAAAVISLSIAGTIAGIYPARKAALLEPVEALRKE